MELFEGVKSQLNDDFRCATRAHLGCEELPWALLMCQLSQRVYEQDQLHADLKGSWQTVITCGPAGLPEQQYRIKLIDSQIAAPDDKAKRQYALWVVPTVGFVAAFRGTADFADVCTDLDFGAEPLHSSTGAEIHLHGGVLRGVPQTVQRILEACCNARCEWPDLPLFWTGSFSST